MALQQLEIISVDDVNRFLKEVVDPLLGPSFHPDTPGDDYTNARGQRVFSDAEAATWDLMVEDCLNVCRLAGLDFYAVAYGVLVRG